MKEKKGPKKPQMAKRVLDGSSRIANRNEQRHSAEHWFWQTILGIIRQATISHQPSAPST